VRKIAKIGAVEKTRQLSAGTDETDKTSVTGVLAVSQGDAPGKSHDFSGAPASRMTI
jgi:hypothetical protein